MKTVFNSLIGGFLLCSSFVYTQVGIGTQAPRTTLDVVGIPANPSVLDGFKAPEITGDQLQAKTYTADQTGAIVYVTVQATAPTGQTANVTAEGHYYFNGTLWVKMLANSDKPDVYFTNNNNLTNIRTAEIFSNSENIVALGVNAARSSEGNRIVAIGDAAAELNSANQVIAIGQNSARENTGEFTHAIGQGAGLKNTGTNLIAIGQGAARENTGNFVNAFGALAAELNSANQLIAIGQNAARNNTAAFVQAIGQGAGRDNEGENLNAIGQGAARENIGSNVNAFGAFAASLNTGSNVIAIGRVAGQNNQGDNNTFIGSVLNDTITGNNNILIGREISLPDNTASHQLNIQNIIYGTGNLGFRGNISNGNIGIGERAPNSKLHVGGSFALPYMTTGAETGVFVLNETHYTVRLFNSISGVQLPNPSTLLGRIYILIGSNGIDPKTLTVNTAGIIYDDVTDTIISTIDQRERLMLQSDGTDWIVIGR